MNIYAVLILYYW